MKDVSPDVANEQAVALGRSVGVGCFTAFVGVWSGGMVGVLIGKVVACVRKAPSCAGLPLCDWHVYAGVGAVVGAITLPILVLRRLRQSKSSQPNA